GDQARLELVVYLTVDEDPLHPDAALAGLVEGADDHAFRRVPQIRPGIDDARRVAAEFEDDTLLAGLRLQFPADVGRTGEAQQLEALVRGQGAGGVAPAGQDREGAGRQRGLGQDPPEHQGTDRGPARRLEHERTAGRQRWRDLVRDQV